MIKSGYIASFCRHSLIALAALTLPSCTQIQKPVTEPFFAATAPPKIQEFRWSNGKRPKSFDPARAAAAPETDIVRAIYEGLTELDPRSLEAVPAVAEQWSSSDDNRVWTFKLRQNALWSNGERITATDFVTSWKRLRALGDKAAHRDLVKNIVGFIDKKPAPADAPDFTSPTRTDSLSKTAGDYSDTSERAEPRTTTVETHGSNADSRTNANAKFGVEAIDDSTLRVTLELPDKDLPKLVANPIFRPIYGDGSYFDKDPLNKNLVTNGPFVIADSSENGVVIERSNTYWDNSTVKLERIRFMPIETAEAALDAYRKGEVDAVTNAQFEPLALKLLTPFDDFRRTKYSTVNLYEFNTKRPPFDDRRVRSALALAIDRERLIETELNDTAQPAYDFLPLGEKKTFALTFDVAKAQDLLERAGYPNGTGFPQVSLVVNRNDLQQRVARSVVRMWKQHLNIDTQIVLVESHEIEIIRAEGNFDLIRRGVVLPTADELVNMSSIFRSVVKEMSVQQTDSESANLADSNRTGDTSFSSDSAGATLVETKNTKGTPELISPEDALYDLYAIPLYFPESYALIKPYVYGFETNPLDAPSIKHIGINRAWQPPNVNKQN